MADRLGWRRKRRRDWKLEDSPLVATAYLYHVLKAASPRMEPRNLRELEHCRSLRVDSQRPNLDERRPFFLALPSCRDGPPQWGVDKATHRELPPDARRFVAGREEEEQIAQDLKDEMRSTKSGRVYLLASSSCGGLISSGQCHTRQEYRNTVAGMRAHFLKAVGSRFVSVCRKDSVTPAGRVLSWRRYVF